MSTRASTDTPILLSSGATGVGTTTLAAHIAPILAAQGVLGTDTLRETLRHLTTRHRHLYTTQRLRAPTSCA
jgi:2-phosphoglycerate kinase